LFDAVQSELDQQRINHNKALGNAIVEVVKQPCIGGRFRAVGFTPMGEGVKAFSQQHTSEVKRWLVFLTEMGLRK
jgi:hypothetical protein